MVVVAIENLDDMLCQSSSESQAAAIQFKEKEHPLCYRWMIEDNIIDKRLAARYDELKVSNGALAIEPRMHRLP